MPYTVIGQAVKPECGPPVKGLCSGEIRLNESWAGVDIGLTQNRGPGVNEAVRGVRGNDHNVTRFHVMPFIADCDGGAAFERERDLDVRVRV